MKPVTNGPFDPKNPAAAGYHLVFNENFPDTSSIDMSNTGAAGFNWYIRRFLYGDVTPTSEITVGTTCDSQSQCLSSLTLTANGTGYNGNYNIATAGPINSSPFWAARKFALPTAAQIRFKTPGL
jgi:hypothetical protein